MCAFSGLGTKAVQRLAGLLLAACAAPALANEPPTEPILRIEAGMHSAGITRISTDKAGRFAVTGSADKTARVWDIASGRLLHVLRIPAGAGRIGQVYPVAMSPDGRQVAVAGFTSFGAPASHSVYLFDRDSGRMLTRLPGLPNNTISLAFSPDGRWLAIGLSRTGGMRLWGQAGTGQVLVDSDIGNDIYSLDWSAEGRLAVASYDGLLRVYAAPRPGAENTIKPAVTERAPSGRRPHSAMFSPDGRQLAVGYADVNQVDILDSQTLRRLFAADTANSGSTELQFAAVSWSDDGRALLAAGRRLVDGRFSVRRWPEGGRGQPADLPVAGNSIFALATLPGGSTLIGTREPSWGVIDASGQWQPKGGPATPNFAGSRASLRLADKGAAVQIGMAFRGTDPHHFDLGRRQLLPGPLERSQAPRTAGLPLTNWMGRSDPQLDGKAIALEQGELAHSIAIDSGAQRFALGSDFSLRMFNSDGRLLWQKPAPSPALAVNITDDDKVVVAAYGDGTIRWHRHYDGLELLALFTHADRMRWILWTPSGYYDAGPGAEDLIGWHVNRGLDQAADFFPASRFRERFHRPDVIDRVLEALSEQLALTQANEARGLRAPALPPMAQALPPVLDLLSGSELTTATAEVTLRVRVRVADDAPVTAWRLRVDGQTAAEVDPRLLAPGTTEREFRVTVPKHDSLIEVFAESRHGVSTPATVRVAWAGPKPAAPVAEPTFQAQPKLYVLAIGVAQYRHAEINSLELAAKDARDFAAAMQRQQGRLYRQVEVKLLTDDQATRDNILDGLEWLSRQVTQHDVGMAFVAGHGLNDPTQGYIYLPVNADPDGLRRTGVPMDEFRKTLANLAGKALFFFDTCHSGHVLGSKSRAMANDVRGVINELSSAENGVVVFSSSTGRQLSYENKAWGNGAFTKALVEGLDGRADMRRSGRITHKMLDVYISERVKELTAGRQSPVTQAPGGVPDFPIAMTR